MIQSCEADAPFGAAPNAIWRPSGDQAAQHVLPPPDANEALLLATYPVSQDDLATLAAARAKAVQDYLLQSGQTEASRLFLKAGEGGLRAEGSRAYLQFQ